MILYFDKYGYLVKKDDQNELWVRGDNNSYTLKAKFYDAEYGTITKDTQFIDLTGKSVSCVVKREDNAQTPTLVMILEDEGKTAKVSVDNWWTEIAGEIKITVRVLDSSGKVKAMGIAYHTIGDANVPSDTTITESEKIDIEQALASKENLSNKTTKVRAEGEASDTLYPTEKAVAKKITDEVLNLQQKDEAIEGKLDAHIANKNNPHEVTKTQIGLGKVENKELDTEVTEGSSNYVQSGAVYSAIKNATGGKGLVPDTRTIAGHDLKSDITAEQLFAALSLGTAAKKNAGNLADQLPIIGTDGKLPLSIIPIGTGLFYGGTLELINNNTWLSPTHDFSNVFGLVPDVEIKIEVTDDYSPAYFICSQSGTFLGLECTVGDWIVCNGANNYVRIDNVDAVISVNGLTGLVVLHSQNVKINSFILGTNDGEIADGDTINEALSKVQNKIKTNIINLPDEYLNLTVDEFNQIISSLKTNKTNILHYATGNTYIDYLVSDYSITEKYMIFLDVQASSVKIIEIELDETNNKVIYFTKEVGAGVDVTFNYPPTATEGILTVEDLNKLQFNEDCKIMFNNEVYRLEDKGHTEGYLTYTHNGYDNNEHLQKCITITISTRSWVLNVGQLATKDYVKEYVGSHSSTVDSKQLVTEVTELGTPTKNDPYIVVKDEEVYRRNALIDTTLPTLYIPEAGYHTYYIVKGNTSTYYIVWSKSDNLSIVGRGDSSSNNNITALIKLNIPANSYYTTANSESEAISKITSSTTTYTKSTSDVTFDLASASSTSSSSYSAEATVSLANPPFIKSSVLSKTYVTSNHCYWTKSTEGLISWYVKSEPTEATQSNISFINGNFSDEITPNSYKKLATKEEVDTKLDKVTTTTSSNQAYVKNMDGSQGMIPIIQGVSGDSIPRRLSDGRLQAKAGTNNDDVVNKKQLDDAIAAAITTALNTAV